MELGLGGMGEESPQLYTYNDIFQHSTKEDCWIVVDNKVYDVSKFLPDHPGGDEVILASTGKDATEDFENVGHSNSARAMLMEYLIGKADVSTFPSRNATPRRTRQPDVDAHRTAVAIKIVLQILLPLFILCFALALRLYAK